MSQIFTPYRSVGVVCDHVAPVVRYHPGHREFYITTAAERKLLTYKVSNAGLKAVSDNFPEDISCLTTHKGQVLAGGSQGTIFVVKNAREVVPAGASPNRSPFRQLVSFGRLLVATTADNRLHTWALDPGICLGALVGSVDFDADAMPLTALCHPPMYANKVLIGSEAGHLQLWNVRLARLVHAFDQLPSGVSCASPAPAEDVVAVGQRDGTTLLLNLRSGAELLRVRQDFGSVAGVAFRTDGQPVMLTGSALGHVTLWHLGDRRVCGLLTEAHTSAIGGIACPHSQPLLLTTGGDNCLRVWRFDRADHLPRLLHQRAGHSLPPTAAEFYNSELLTSSLDGGVRLFSLEHDRHNRCFGKGKRNKLEPLPPAVRFACETARHGDWCTMVALHQRSRLASTWDIRKGCQGQRRLEPICMSSAEALHKSTVATAVHLTACGNFVLIGYSSGHVIRYNVQSGREAKRPYQPTPEAAVVSVHCDACNRVVAVADAGAELSIFAFRRGHRLCRLRLPTPPICADLHRLSGLLALGCADAARLYQLGPQLDRPLREFRADDVVGDVGGPPRLVRFSQDGRWLLVARGNRLATFSVLHGRQLDILVCDAPIACAAVSPAGDLLVTGHDGRVGLQVWVNTTLFRPLSVSLPPPPSPSESAQLSGLVTLSGLAPSRWQCLPQLEEIRARNRPLEAPLVPKSAPFFLTADALAADADVGDGGEGDGGEKATTMASGGGVAALSDLSARLLGADGDADRLADCVAFLESLGPTAIDSELRDVSEDAFAAFLEAAAACLRRGDHFETCQAYLSVFLKHHGLSLASLPTCREPLATVGELQRSAWRRLESQFQETDCLLTYTRDGVIGNVL